MASQASQPSKGEVRRTDILAEARRVLLAEGYQKLSLRQIAATLEMSLGNLQYYFPSKDDLVETVIAHEIDTSLEIAQAADWDPSDGGASARSAVRAILRHHASEAGRFYVMAEALAQHEARFARLKARGYAHVFQQVEQLVAAQAPRLDADQRHRLARLLVALIDGASLQVQFGQAGASTTAIDALSEDIAAAVSHLVTHWR